MLASELGIIRQGHEQSTSRRLSSNVALSQTWSLSQDANKKCGSCRVCFATRQLHMKDGTVHNHGPRSNPCSGSHQPPLPDSVQLRQVTSVTAASASADPEDTIPARQLSSTPLSIATAVLHPRCNNSLILKRIPKGARPSTANLLLKLIRDVLQHPLSTASWSKLFGFPSACLTKPIRGGKSRNLTTQIVKNVFQYDQGAIELPSKPPGFHSPHRVNPAKTQTHDEAIARMASVKLEDGDVKGAVRLLCSDDRLAVPDESTLEHMRRLHPAAPPDRRPVPIADTPPLQVLPSAVRTACQSFPNGSAAGPDGLRPQHLKDLLVAAPDDSQLLVAITDLTNFLLEGNLPSSVTVSLFGANLFAIRKNNGGIRPIAVGYVWRRLSAKVACSHAREVSSSLLGPRQLGFGVSGGTEAAVRAARCYLENMDSSKLFVKIDFRNAFNTVRRDAILDAVAKHLPELLPFAASTLSTPSDLQFANFTLQSEEGAQQGDPLGPLYFCLAIIDLLKALKSELVLAYLDDITLGDDANTVLRDFLQLEASAHRLGLEINREKCEVVGHTDATRSLFAANDITLLETSPSSVVLLGAPLSAGPHLDSLLEERRDELLLLSKRLQFMPAHDSLFLLRNILAAPRLMHLLRSTLCIDSPVLPLYDSVLRESLSETLNVDLDDVRWNQASLPVRWGGLGVRGVVLLAPSAFLASAASTKELTSTLLPARLRATKSSGIDAAVAAWTRQATNPFEVSILPATPSLPVSTTQRVWDHHCCKVKFDQLLFAASDPVDRARLLASCSPGSGDWLHALPLSSVGLKLDNATVRISAGLRLGAPVVRSHTCVCGSTVTVDGHHGLSCRHGSGRHSRHDQINDLLYRAFASAGTLATREPQSLCTSTGKRPDGVTLIPWRRGRCLAWDATCPDTFALCHVAAGSNEAGCAAATAERKKCQKYSDIISGVDFVPVAIETSGVWGKQALELVKEIGRRIAAITFDKRSVSFLRQRLSIAIQRGNAYCVLGTFPKTHVVDGSH